MGIVIGIDVGISTTKIVGIDEQGKVLRRYVFVPPTPLRRYMELSASICMRITSSSAMWRR